MADARVRAIFSGDSASFVAASREAAIAADASAADMKAAADDASNHTSGAFSSMSQKILGSVDNMFGTNFSKAAEKASSELDSVGSHSSSLVSKLTSLGGASVLALGIIAAGAAAYGIDLAEKFQTTTATIAALGGVSVAQAKKITDAFLSTAGTTIYSGQQIADAYAGVVGQLGATEGHALTAAQALTVMKNAMDYAEATGTDLTSATKALVDVMQAYGLSVTQASSATDVLFSVQQKTGMGASQVSQAVIKAHLALGQLNPSLKDTGGLLVDLAQHGVAGSRGINSVITSIAAADQKLSAAGHHFSNLGQMIAFLQKQTAGMSRDQAIATLKLDGFGSSAGKVYSTVQAGAGVLDKDTVAVGKAGSAHAAASKQAQTLAHQIDLIKATVKDWITILGEHLVPIVLDVTKDLTKLVTWLLKTKDVLIPLGVLIGGTLVTAMALWTAAKAKAFATDTLGAIQGLIGGFEQLAAKIGIGTAANDALAVSQDTAAASSDALAAGLDATDAAAAANPIGAILLAVVALGVGIYELVKHWKTVWHDVEMIANDAWGFIKKWGPLVAEAFLVPFTGGMSLIVPMMIKHWGAIESFFTSIPGRIERLLSGAIHWLSGVGGDVINGFVNGLDAVWNGVGSWFENLGKDVVHLIGHALGFLWQAGKDLITGFWNGVKDVWGKFISWVINEFHHSFVGKILSFLGIGSPSKVFHEIGLNTMLGLRNGIMAGTGGVNDAMYRATTGLGTAAAGGLSISSIGSGGTSSSRSGASAPVYLQIDGQTFARLLLPVIQTQALQGKQNGVKIGMS